MGDVVTTASSITEIIQSEIIELVGQDFSKDNAVVAQLAKKFSLPPGSGSGTKSIWKFVSDLGTPGDAGVAVDLEFQVAETASAESIELETEATPVALSEYVVYRLISDVAMEDMMGGMDFVSAIMQNSARILAQAIDKDLCDHIGDASNSVGTTNVAMDIDDMMDALVGIRNRGVHAPDNCSYVLEQNQAVNYEDFMTESSTSSAIYAGAADRFLFRGEPSADPNGLGVGIVGNFRGCTVYMTGLFATANGGNDVEGGCLVHDTPANSPMAALAYVQGRPFRLEEDRDAPGRSTQLVASTRVGTDLIEDDAVTLIVTDA